MTDVYRLLLNVSYKQTQKGVINISAHTTHGKI